MRLNAEKVVATKGNQSVFPSGQAVYDAEGVPNVLPGQLVVFDPKRNISLGNTIAPSNIRLFSIGVGWDPKGTGRSIAIRQGFGDGIWGEGIMTATAEPYRCAQPHVIDMLYRCTDFDTVYSVNIRVENDKVQNQYPFGKDAVWTHTVKTTLPPCDSCSASHNARELSCLLADAINQKDLNTNPLKTSTFYGTRVNELFYEALPLYAQSDIYCINPIAGACEGCNSVGNIKSITITGESPVIFTNTVNPADPTQTLIGQLDGLVKQINEVFAASTGTRGNAVITGGTSECCPLRLELNHCDAPGDVVLIDNADATIVPCATGTPLAAVPVVNDCQDCPPVAGTVTYDGGIRLVSKPRSLKYERGGYPSNPSIGYFSQTLEINGSTGFDEIFYREVQSVVEPENLGYQWINREYLGDVMGGSGRKMHRFNSNVGPLHLPREQSPAANLMVEAKENYCSYLFTHRLPFSTGSPGTAIQGARGLSSILIPNGDTVTQAEFEAIINNYLAGTPFALDSVTCSADQDQDATYASGVLTLTAEGLATEIVTIGTTVYTFVETLTGAAYEILDGATPDETESAANLSAAINGGAGEGSVYGTGTIVHPNVSASPAAGVITVTANLAGTAGNLIATTTDVTGATWGAAVLVGGLDSQTPEIYPNANGFVI